MCTIERPALRILVVALVSTLALACSDSVSPSPDPEPPDEIVLPLRVHVLRSSRVASLSAPITLGDARALAARVNEVWAQAGIRWDIESIVEEEALVSPTVENAFGTDAVSASVLLQVVSEGNRLGGWDAYLVRDFGSAGFGGIYFNGTGIAFAKLADETNVVEPVDFGTRVFAHELGHSLSLPHVTCPPQGNLMAPGCAGEVRTRLSDGQIAAARRQALTGRPF